MPASGSASFVLRPLRSPLWWLAGASAAALFTVAAVAWKAANQQRRDGEGALRQVAADAAQRALLASLPSLNSGLPFGSCSVVHREWFTRTGEPNDWIFGPWPQPENEFSKAYAEAQALLRAGKREEARKLLESPQGPLATFAARYSGEIRLSHQMPAVNEGQAILTPSGLPLGPLVLRLRMDLASGEAERRAAAEELLISATVSVSPLSAMLVEEAAREPGEASDAEKNVLAMARAAVFRNERLRPVARARRSEIAGGSRWINDEWHLLPVPRFSPIGVRLVVRSREDLRRFIEEMGLSRPAGPGLPADWVFHASVDAVDVGEHTPPAEAVMATAASGSLTVEVVCRDPTAAFASLDAQLTRQRWLIGGSTGFMGAALTGFLFVVARQRKLNAMMSNFVASVSHELRAPIGSMGLLAERLGEGRTSGAEEQARYHQLIRGECRRLSATIDNVLAFSRMERGRRSFEPELSDLTSLLRDAAELIRPLADERGVSISTDFPEPAVERELDPVMIRQAVLNLLDNALKFSPPRGTIHLNLQESNGEALIIVRDEGPGTPPAERIRIFEPFYRIGSELRRETPGIGIGLAIVRDVAAAHGGSATAGDAPGKGAEFVLRLGRIPDTPP